MNPNVCLISGKMISDGLQFYVIEANAQIPKGFYEVCTINSTVINYWNKEGFIAMALGLVTILFGFVFGDIKIQIRKKKHRYTPQELGNLRDR